MESSLAEFGFSHQNVLMENKSRRSRAVGGLQSEAVVDDEILGHQFA